jgi:chromosome segregation ATPase
MSETVTEAPSQVTGEREQLLSALADADVSAFDLTANTISIPQVEKPDKESAKQEDTPEEEAPEQQPDEEKLEETQEEEQPKSKYSRAKKSQDRANKSWREVNEAKAALKKEREELDAQKKAYQDGHEKSIEEIQQRTNTSRYSPEEYESIAQEFEDEGDHANAEAARKAAKQARQTATEQEQKKQQAEFVSKWDTNWKQATASHKDLNNQDSDLFKMVGQLLERKPVLTQYPEGITDAVEAE